MRQEDLYSRVVSVNDEKVTDIGFVVTESMLKDGAKIKKGKKKFHKAIMD